MKNKSRKNSSGFFVSISFFKGEEIYYSPFFFLDFLDFFESLSSSSSLSFLDFLTFLESFSSSLSSFSCDFLDSDFFTVSPASSFFFSNDDPNGFLLPPYPALPCSKHPHSYRFASGIPKPMYNRNRPHTALLIDHDIETRLAPSRTRIKSLGITSG